MPSDADEEEETVKIVQLVKSDEPLVRELNIYLFMLASMTTNQFVLYGFIIDIDTSLYCNLQYQAVIGGLNKFIDFFVDNEPMPCHRAGYHFCDIYDIIHCCKVST